MIESELYQTDHGLVEDTADFIQNGRARRHGPETAAFHESRRSGVMAGHLQ
jgi:hypothetical protein